MVTVAVPRIESASATNVLSDRYQVSVEEYAHFRRDGFLIVRNLVSIKEIEELRQHTEDLMQGKLPEQQGRRMADRDSSKDGAVTVQGLESPPDHLSAEEKVHFFLRIHMLHRKLELHERYMLHPRVLDVVEVLIGPDVRGRIMLGGEKESPMMRNEGAGVW